MSTHAAAAVAQRIGHPEPAYVDAILQDTWGHLNPQVREIYRGHIIIAASVFSGHGVVPLSYDFKTDAGVELESSPWFYSDLNHFVIDAVRDKPGDPRGWGVWRWEGTFERLKNGSSKWRGKARPMRLQYRFSGRK